MYLTKPSFVYGFHGIDRDAAIRILNQEDDFRHSNNSYDWLGNGIYFWENNYQRAIREQVTFVRSDELNRSTTKLKIK